MSKRPYKPKWLKKRKPKSADEIYREVFETELKILQGQAPSQIAHQRRLEWSLEHRRREVEEESAAKEARQAEVDGKWGDAVRQQRERPMEWMSRQTLWRRISARGRAAEERRGQAARAGEAHDAWGGPAAAAPGSRWAELTGGMDNGPLKSQKAAPSVKDASAWDKLAAAAGVLPSKSKNATTQKAGVGNMKSGSDKTPGFEDRLLSSTAKTRPSQPQPQKGTTSSGAAVWDWDRFHSDGPQKSAPAKKNNTPEPKTTGFEDRFQSTPTNSAAQPQAQKSNTTSGAAVWDWDRFMSDDPRGSAPRRQSGTARPRPATPTKSPVQRQGQRGAVRAALARNQGMFPSGAPPMTAPQKFRDRNQRLEENRQRRGEEGEMWDWEPKPSPDTPADSGPLESEQGEAASKKAPWDFDDHASMASQARGLDKSRSPGDKNKAANEFNWGKFFV